jgi:hypothetical protein
MTRQYLLQVQVRLCSLSSLTLFLKARDSSTPYVSSPVSGVSSFVGRSESGKSCFSALVYAALYRANTVLLGYVVAEPVPDLGTNILPARSPATQRPSPPHSRSRSRHRSRSRLRSRSRDDGRSPQRLSRRVTSWSNSDSNAELQDALAEVARERRLRTGAEEVVRELRVTLASAREHGSELRRKREDAEKEAMRAQRARREAEDAAEDYRLRFLAATKRAHESEELAETANARANAAEARLEQLEKRAVDAEARADDAEARAIAATKRAIAVEPPAMKNSYAAAVENQILHTGNRDAAVESCNTDAQARVATAEARAATAEAAIAAVRREVKFPFLVPALVDAMRLLTADLSALDHQPH